MPVLLIRARSGGAAPPTPVRRLLVPLDGSALAEQALPLATDLAKRAVAEVILVESTYWAQMAMTDYPYGYPVGGEALLEEVEAGARAYLAEVSQRLATAGITAQADVRFTPAADAILTCAEERRADLIVMCTHGHGGPGRWVLGSVADRVLRGATLPVLLVRADMPAAEASADPARAAPST
jgi:nucleotide-binding universal stress UspA family protein